MDNWQPGDLAECIDDKWEDLEGHPLIGLGLPTLGSVHMVAAVSMLPHDEKGPSLVLQLIGGCGGWLEAVAFRKVPPRGEDQLIKVREEVTA